MPCCAFADLPEGFTLRTANVATVVTLLCLVGPVHGKGLFEIGRHVIIAEAFAERCLPELKRGKHIPDFEALVAALKAAMTGNAVMLRPEAPADKLASDVEQFVEGWRRDAASLPQPCDAPTIQATKDNWSNVTSSETFSAIETAGATVGPYDMKHAIVGQANGPTTYADEFGQQNLFQGIRSNQDGACAEPLVEEVVHVSRTPKEVANLPPFILTPIFYEERWLVRCGDESVWWHVSFSQDSEGPKGLYSVQAATP